MALQQIRLACFVTLMLAVAFPAAAEEAPGDDVATDMINRLDTLVMPLIKEGHLNDTTLVTNLLSTLSTKATAASDKKAATDAPDTALDECYLKENSTLAAWKQCNTTRADEKAKMDSDCDNQQNNAVASFTISKPVYKQGSGAKPQAKCNFEDYTLEGGDNAGCESFLDDITSDAKTEFDSQYATYTAAAKDCSDSKTAYDDRVVDCSAKGKAYRDQEATCTLKETDLKVKVCAFQTALKAKCTAYSQTNKAIQDLATQESARNKELRTVSLTKCLFDQYKTKGETCFKTTVLNHCEKQVNGASQEYATAAAEQIHEYRTTAKSHMQVLPCEAQTITIGTNGISYKQIYPSDPFSYYAQHGPRTYSSAGPSGVLAPSECVTE